MALKQDNLSTNAAENSLLSPQVNIVSDFDLNVTIGAADAAVLLGVGYPIGKNDSTGDHAPWMAPDPTVVVITLTGATGGTFTITVNSATTSAIAHNASAATIVGALKAIGYDVSVVKASLVYTLTFDGAEEIRVLPTVTADTSLATGDVTESVTINDGTAQVPDPTILNIDMEDRTGGTFTVTYNGNTTAAIAFAATKEEIDAAILAIGTAPPVSVTVFREIGVSEIAIVFDDLADLLSLPTVSFTSSLTGGTGDNDNALVGNVIVPDETDVVIEVGTATGGTFTVTVNQLTTAPIAFDASVGAVDSALLAIGFTVSTALVSTAYTITFDALAEVVTLPTVTGDISALTGAGLTTAVTVGTSTNGTDEIRGFVNPEDVQTGINTAAVTLSRVTTTATAVTVNPHALVTGMSLTFSGAANSTYNITATITVVTATTFTYTVVDTGDNVDSATYTTTNDIMAIIMVKGQISAALPESLVASVDVAALRTALKDGLIAKGIIVQGLVGRF